MSHAVEYYRLFILWWAFIVFLRQLLKSNSLYPTRVQLSVLRFDLPSTSMSCSFNYISNLRNFIRLHCCAATVRRIRCSRESREHLCAYYVIYWRPWHVGSLLDILKYYTHPALSRLPFSLVNFSVWWCSFSNHICIIELLTSSERSLLDVHAYLSGNRMYSTFIFRK